MWKKVIFRNDVEATITEQFFEPAIYCSYDVNFKKEMYAVDLTNPKSEEQFSLSKNIRREKMGGFTPQKLGLNNVTGKFEEPRPDNCPHKGTDFGSANTPKDFKAGTNGTIQNPVGGEWGTITLKPSHDNSMNVQYLHCSEIYVTAGQNVTKNTVIDKTGKKAPLGSEPDAIHLHIQVYDSGPAKYPCWGNRNFNDPEEWDTCS